MAIPPLSPLRVRTLSPMSIVLRAVLLGSSLSALAACANTGMSANASLAALRPEATTLSILSVSGPSTEISQRFSSVLESEAKARGYAINATGTGGTRVAAFLDSYPVEGGKLAFSWVLQTSEDGRKRAARVSGAATTTAAASAGWAALDQTTMRQIAARSLDDLTRVLTQSSPSEQPLPSEEGPASE